MRSLTRIRAGATAVVLALGLTACEGDSDEAGKAERSTNAKSYEQLVDDQPAHAMSHSSTRETINFWIDTWGEPGKVSYNYIGTFDQDGKYVVSGYYVLEGLPVSMCASLTPPYKYEDRPGDEDDVEYDVPAPGMDGAYYNGAGDCSRYYGKDAATGQYIEYTVPMNAMVRTTDQPIDNVNAPALGPSTVDDVQRKEADQ